MKLIRDTEKSTGLQVVAETYKKPKPCEDDRLLPYFSWKSGIALTFTEEVSPEMFGPALGERAEKLLTQLIPLYEFFNQFQV